MELGARLPAKSAAFVEGEFERAYAEVYGRRPPGVEPEVLSWRVRTSGPKPRITTAARRARGAQAAPTSRTGILTAPATRRPSRRRIYSAERDRFVGAAVLDRYSLEPGAKIIGPAIVEERESTVVIGVGGTGIVDRSGALVVSVDG